MTIFQCSDFDPLVQYAGRLSAGHPILETCVFSTKHDILRSAFPDTLDHVQKLAPVIQVADRIHNGIAGAVGVH